MNLILLAIFYQGGKIVETATKMHFTKYDYTGSDTLYSYHEGGYFTVKDNTLNIPFEDILCEKSMRCFCYSEGNEKESSTKKA